jgi:hypothetical protein
MKPIPAIVEKAQVDVELIERQLIVEIAGERDDVRNAERHEGLAAAARESAEARRKRIGALLAKARAAWPARGPNAKGWGEFLRKVNIGEDTALRYMGEARGDFPQPAGKLSPGSGASPRDAAPANVHGGSGERVRGAYCTPKKWADAVGAWDLDPFSNPQSHIVSRESCQLERGDNGLLDPKEPGSYLIAGAERRAEPFDLESDDAIVAAASRGRRVAGPTARVWIQPDYSFVEAAIAHYAHTRFCALLRFAPDTGWFAALWPHVRVLAIPRERIAFEAPDGIEADGAPFPHALYYTDARDLTAAVRELCIVLRVDQNT